MLWGRGRQRRQGGYQTEQAWQCQCYMWVATGSSQRAKEESAQAWRRAYTAPSMTPHSEAKTPKEQDRGAGAHGAPAVRRAAAAKLSAARAQWRLVLPPDLLASCSVALSPLLLHIALGQVVLQRIHGQLAHGLCGGATRQGFPRVTQQAPQRAPQQAAVKRPCQKDHPTHAHTHAYTHTHTHTQSEMQFCSSANRT